MLAVLLATVGQLIVSIKRNNRALEHHAVAMRTVENCLEEICNLPWDEIDSDAVASMKLSDNLLRLWPEAKVTGNVELLTEPLQAKRLALRLSLSDNPRAKAARLTTWIYREPNGN
jgi:hypothetical protein